MREKPILVLVPDSLGFSQSGYLRGYRKLFENTEVYCITSNSPTKTIHQSVGFIGPNLDYQCIKLKADLPLFINSSNKQIYIDSCKNKPVTQIYYDYKRFKNSDILYVESEKYGQCFKLLSRDLDNSKHLSSENGKNKFVKYLLFLIHIFDCLLNMFTKLQQIVKTSTTFTHFEETIKSFKWMLTTSLEQKKITPKLGNAVIAKLVDLALGIFLTKYILDYEEQISTFLDFIIQSIITNLRGLLLYLMGQPIGLKLNYGYNNFLGRFFLYHISLWKIFLHGLYPVFKTYLKFFVLVGIMGFSYQIAMISDILSIATFHSYCIYIYAARLFNFQLICLKSLWRVLIGRKLNPLRNRIDSCQYSQNQLFVGTLTFTILLFLLPTTTMYYVVFFVFRLVTIFINGLLLKLMNLLYTNPIYSVFLWTTNSSSIAGNVNIFQKNCNDGRHIEVEAKLERPPLLISIKKVAPDSVNALKTRKTFGEVFHSSITGRIL